MLSLKESTLNEITKFILRQEDILVAFLVGSQARSSTPADEWSDVDIVIATRQPEKYIDSANWLNNLGLDPVITFVEGTAVGGQKERRVLFRNGVDVDFAVFPLRKFELLIGSIPKEVMAVFSRGIKVIKDSENLLVRVQNIEPKLPYRAPTESEFNQALSDFLYHFVWSARKIRRGELWTGKMASDGYMKMLLLQMIEWYMHSKKGDDFDTWHNGRFVEKWADEDIVKDLHSVFSRYDRLDMQSGLFSTVDLYTRLARSLAKDLGFKYPVESEEFARAEASNALGDVNH
jgi:aminoglycoside 6-adenylyltransferase